VLSNTSFYKRNFYFSYKNRSISSYNYQGFFNGGLTKISIDYDSSNKDYISFGQFDEQNNFIGLSPKVYLGEADILYACDKILKFKSFW
jgi:hypothetical protein